MPIKTNWQALLGAFSNAVGDIDTANTLGSQRDELNRGYGAIAGEQQRANKLIGDTVAGVRASTPDTYAAPLARDYSAAAQRPTIAASTAPRVGSSRFKSEQLAAGKNARAYGGRSAGALAVVDAASRQRQAESNLAAQAGSDLQTVGRSAGLDDFLARMAAARQRPNPWTTLLAGIGTRIAQNYVGANPADQLQEIDLSTIPARRY
jgi:hypothetical protein